MSRVVTVLGFVLLVPVGILYLGSGLVVPLPWLVGLWAIGVALAVYAVVHRAQPWHVLATPLVGAAIWFAVVSLGDAFLDWTA